MHQDEKPRDAYLAACRAIAERFAGRGFTFARSGPHLTRRAPPYAFQISFGSSRYNVAGSSAAVWVAAMVESRELARWRRAADPDNEDSVVAGGWLHLLAGQNAFLEWNVADPTTRASVVNDVVDAIERIALPYFGLFPDERLLANRLAAAPIPMFEGLRAIDWLLWKGRRDEALALGGRLLRDGGRRRKYARLLDRYRRGEMRGRWIGDVEELAYATVTYGLEF
jgi:hypothetical protein